MSNFEDIIKKLEKEDSKIIKEEIKELTKSNKYEKELIDIVENFQKYNNFVPLWAITILGERQNKKSIPALMKIFDYKNKEDFFPFEAAFNALRKIGEKYPNEVFVATKEKLEKYLEMAYQNSKDKDKTEESSKRIYLYHILPALAPKEEVFNYLLEKVTQDYLMASDFVYYLLAWPIKKELKSLLRRQIELSLISRGGYGLQNPEFINFKWTLIDYTKGLTGDKFKYKKELENSWENKWKNIFSEWDKINEPKKKDSAKKEQPNNEEKKKLSKERIAKLRKEQIENKKNEINFLSFDLPDFKISDYLENRKLNPIELLLKKTLKDKKINYTIEEIEKRFQKEDPYKIADELKKKASFKNKEEEDTFSNSILNLWYITPLEKYWGISTAEKNNFEKYFSKVKINRNAPCPCGKTKKDGTPIKFKKCCGQRFKEK